MLQIGNGRPNKLLALSKEDIKRLKLEPEIFIVDAKGNIQTS